MLIATRETRKLSSKFCPYSMNKLFQTNIIKEKKDGFYMYTLNIINKLTL